jgi:hypothetical protein
MPTSHSNLIASQQSSPARWLSNSVLVEVAAESLHRRLPAAIKSTRSSVSTPFGSFPAEAGADRAFAEAFCREASYSGVSLESMREAVGKTGVGHRIELVQGDVRQTIERYVEDNPGFRIALLYLDFDVAPATMAALECLYDRVVHGGIIVFGEYGLAACTEANAVDNFLRDRGISVKLRSLSWNMSPTAFFVKP